MPELAPPTFPQPYVTDRIRQLGYGSGPWRREQLDQLWGPSLASKITSEAKAAGWLVSPYRGTYFVPAAGDLTVVPWLPEPLRDEFLVSRTLASGEVPYWCLSAWCRRRGLELGFPLFVTDLGILSRRSKALPDDRKALRNVAVERGAAVSSLPFLEALLIVPAMPPPAKEMDVETFLATQDPAAEKRRQGQKMMGEFVVGVGALIALAFKKDISPLDRELKKWQQKELQARAIPYQLGPELGDEAWILGLLASLGTPRLEELVARAASKISTDLRARIQRWAGLIGPPQPNDNWTKSISEGPFPFLLVPGAIWKEMGADQAARRYRILDRLGAT